MTKDNDAKYKAHACSSISYALRIFTATMVLLSGLSASRAAAIGPQWYIEKRDLGVKLPESVQKAGPYSIVISRRFNTPREGALLRKAEAVYPNAGEVREAIKTSHYKLGSRPGEDEPLWYYSEFDHVRIPYSVTAGAVAYYYRLLAAFEHGDFSATHNVRMIQSSLHYIADVHYYSTFTQGRQSFRNVYVASLDLSWFQYCGRVCAMAFQKKRIVVLSADGTIRGVFLDGHTRVEVS